MAIALFSIINATVSGKKIQLRFVLLHQVVKTTPVLSHQPNSSVERLVQPMRRPSEASASKEKLRSLLPSSH